MTVTTSPMISGPYEADGVTDEWDFTFKVKGATHLKIIVADDEDGADAVEYTTGYTLDDDYLNKDAGGVVVFPSSGDLVEDGKFVWVSSNVPYEQDVLLTRQGAYNPAQVMAGLDKLSIQIKQLSRNLGQAADNFFENGLNPGGALNDGIIEYSNLSATLKALIGGGGGGGETIADLRWVSPEDFGAQSDLSTDDDTAAVEACLEAAASDGVGVYLKRVYRVGEMLVPAGVKELNIFGHSAPQVLRDGTVVGSGMMPLDAGMTHMLKLGEAGSGVERVRFDNWFMFGDDQEFEKGMLWVYKAAMGVTNNFSCLRARAPGIYANKMEDWIHNNIQLNCLGSEDFPGAISFGDKPADDTFGNNAIWFKGGRIEFVDGGYIVTDKTATAPWASSVFVDGMKIETFSSAAYGSVPLYGDTSIDYPMIDFGKGNADRITFEIKNSFFSNADTNSKLVKLGACDGFTMKDCLISANDETLTLIDISDDADAAVAAKDVAVYDNKSRIYADDPSARRWTWINKSTYAARIEAPVDLVTGGQIALPSPIVPASSIALRKTASRSMVADPDPTTDPAPVITKSVVKATGNTTMLFLSRAPLVTISGGDTTVSGIVDNYVGLVKGFSPFLKVRFILKREATVAQATLLHDVGVWPSAVATVLATFDCNETWTMTDPVVVDMRNGGINLRLNWASGNDPAAIVYCAGIIYEWTNTLEGSGPPGSGTFYDGDLFRREPPVPGRQWGWAYSETAAAWRKFGGWVDSTDVENLTPGTVNAGVVWDSGDLTFTGAALGDKLKVVAPGAVGGCNVYANVTATDTYRIYIHNPTAGNIVVGAGNFTTYLEKV